MKDLYFEMLRIRMIEERIAKEYPKGHMRCPVHLSIGQEAPAVGVCAALNPQDKMVGTHRSHAWYLAKGGSLKGLIGELYGKSSGCARGNGGSMHLIDLNCNFWGSTSIVAGTIPVGVGLAFADKMRGNDSITAICFGDAAIEEGVFHESANFAALHKLPVLFVCENNQYSCYTHISKRQPNRALKAIAEAHGFNYLLSSANVNDIQLCAKMLVKIGEPAFLEIPSWRHLEHCGPNNDDHLKYRTEEPIKDWRFETECKDDVNKISLEINEAFEHAKGASYPDHSEVGKYAYAPSNI